MKKITNQTNYSGITLIALVITIIVLLILVGVSISFIVTENGILSQATTSKDETRAATIEELRNVWWSEIKIDEISEEKEARSLDEVLTELENNSLITNDEKNYITENGYIQINNKKIYFLISKLSEVGQIGDLVNYTPNANTEYFVDSTYSGYTGSYYITQENLNWKIFNISNDGTIYLIPDTLPTQKVYIYASGSKDPKAYNAYNNIVYILNNLCKNLYSNSQYGTARSINLNDITKLINPELLEEAKTANNYGASRNAKSSSERNYPNIALKESNLIINNIVGNRT